MKIIKQINESDLPKAFLEGFTSSESIYCDYCDGIRAKTHTCYCFMCHKSRSDCKGANCWKDNL